jgi:Flp pilus assembly protein TadD
LPPEISIGGPPLPQFAKVGRALRVAGLMAERGGHDAAIIKALGPAQASLPQEQRIKAMLGKAYEAVGRAEDAWRQVEELGPTMSPYAETYALRGMLLGKRGDEPAAQSSQFKALSLDPWKTTVACEMLVAPALPSLSARAALCESARRWP